MLQGIGLGGEWGGAVAMTYEYATEDKRGLYASFPQIGLSIGLCLSAGIVAIASNLPEDQFLAWGWRAPEARSAAFLKHAARRLETLLARLSKFQRCGRSR